jgi:hypothetical protein
MAIGHIVFKTRKAGYARPHALYIAGGGRYGCRTDVLYCKDENLPRWASDGADFFGGADSFERCNGRAYLEIEFAIPRECVDPIGWACQFAAMQLGGRYAYRLAIHQKPAADGGPNIHAHLMFSDRQLDGVDRPREMFFKRAASRYRNRKTGEMQSNPPERGGAKKSKDWNKREKIQMLRDAFEKHIQRVVRTFRLTKAITPEPKIGPVLLRAGHRYEERRATRAQSVDALRAKRREDDAIRRLSSLIYSSDMRPTGFDQWLAKGEHRRSVASECTRSDNLKKEQLNDFDI